MQRTILFVEDDEDDRELLFDVVHEIDPALNVVFAENGVKAIEYLDMSKQNSHLPCLIVLDLNMPFLDGKETLQKIKQELKLDSIPVIVYSSSSHPDDIMLFKTLGVEYFTKPDDLSDMNRIVRYMVEVCYN